MAAVVLIVEDKPRPRVLAISRGRNKNNWALPGGHTEPGDQTPRVTASRELYEETGVLVKPQNLQLVYSGRVPVYSPSKIDIWPARLRSHPFEGYVAWKRPSVLCRPSATYSIYAKRVFSAVGLHC